MTRLIKWTSLSFLVWVGGCAYPAQQMVAVPALPPAAIAAQAAPDPICDDDLERAESADVVGVVGEDVICALTKKMTASQ